MRSILDYLKIICPITAFWKKSTADLKRLKFTILNHKIQQTDFSAGS
jgi:hypothetical protein